MPIAKIQLPDGRIARFEVSEGTTPDQVLEFANKQDWSQSQPATDSGSDFRQYAIDAAGRNGIPEDLALKLIDAESSWDTKAKSSKGATGLMQVMPGTFKEMGGTDPNDPKQNIDAGMKYLGLQMKRYQDPALALAAYNAGPGAVDKAGGMVPNYPETVAYVQKILGAQPSVGNGGVGPIPADQRMTAAAVVDPSFKKMSPEDIRDIPRHAIRSVSEMGGMALGGAGGALMANPGSVLVGGGLGYAAGKRVGDTLVQSYNALIGDKQQQESSNAFMQDAAIGSAFQGAGNLVGKGITNYLIPSKLGQNMYRRSMSINKMDWTEAEKKAATEFGLSKKIIASEEPGAISSWLGMKGKADVKNEIRDLNNQVTNIINEADQVGNTINAQKVVQRLDDLIDKGKRIEPADPEFIKIIEKIKDDFLYKKSKNPEGDIVKMTRNEIPIADARRMKQHIYKAYEDFYGSPNAVKTEITGKKALARGLKEELENKYPQIKELNLSQSELLNFLDPLNRTLQRNAEKSMVSEAASAAAMTTAGYHTPYMWASHGRRALTSDAIGSRMAVLLDMLKTKSPGEVRKIIGAATPNALIGIGNYKNENALSR
jgi:hypothetical protein